MLRLKFQYFGHLMWELTHWKRPWCWKRLKVGREGDDRGWDGWMASPTQWIWVWVNSRCWWWTERCGMLQSMGSQRVRHNWVTELNWGELSKILATLKCYSTEKLINVLYFYYIVTIFKNEWTEYPRFITDKSWKRWMKKGCRTQCDKLVLMCYSN